MTGQPPSNAPGEEYFNPGPYLPPDYGGMGGAPRPPFNKMAIWGFVLSCVSLFVFGFLGLPGMILGVRGLRQIRTNGGRGRGLAIAAAIIGAAAAIFYLLGRFIHIN
jgi:hypothetical protein